MRKFIFILIEDIKPYFVVYRDSLSADCIFTYPRYLRTIVTKCFQVKVT